MMQRIFFIAALFILTACNGERSQDEYISNIESIEEEIAKAETYNKENYEKAVELMSAYAQKYRSDTARTPVYLSKAARYYGQMGQFDTTSAAKNYYEQAFQRIDTLVANFPEHSQAANMQFYKAVLYEQGVRDVENARRAYLKFIDSHTSHELVQDALFSLEHLGKSDEQIFQEIMKRRDSTAVQ